MSFTPASGVPWAPGQVTLDPGIVGFLLRQTTMTAEDFNHMVSSNQGWLGIWVIVRMETLLQQSTDNPKAADAINLFCYRLGKQ